MCYSVLVETDLRKLENMYGAHTDEAAFASVYRARAAGQTNMHIPRALDANFFTGTSSEAQAIQQLAREFVVRQTKMLEEKLIEKKQLIEELENKLAKKWFKTTQQRLETTIRVVEKTQLRVARLNAATEHGSPEDSRVVQYSYAPLIVREGGRNLIRPFRYQVRARNTAKEPNRKINMFNARIETIRERTTWKHLFMHNHGVLPYKGFYEWVEHPQTKATTEIYFSPQGRSDLWAPALYESWNFGPEKINSFAIITSAPPPEVEKMGHDRCPLFPKVEFINDWLNPQSCNPDYVLQQLLSKEPVTYEYIWPER